MIPQPTNPGGLLWFDDDPRRPVQEKIAQAAQRYRERVGYEPTVCQLNPAQAAALANGTAAGARGKRAQAPTRPAGQPVALRMAPNDAIQPHCFLITIGADERPRPANLRPVRAEPPAAPPRRRVPPSAPARVEPAAIAVGAKARRKPTAARGAAIAPTASVAPAAKRATPAAKAQEAPKAAPTREPRTRAAPRDTQATARPEGERPIRGRTPRTGAMGGASALPTPALPAPTARPKRPGRAPAAAPAVAPEAAPTPAKLPAKPRRRTPAAQAPVIQPALPLPAPSQRPRKRSA